MRIKRRSCQPQSNDVVPIQLMSLQFGDDNATGN